MCGASDDGSGGGVTVATFTRGGFGVSIVDGTFSVRRYVCDGYYQNDLHSVCLALLCATVRFA